jgi:hypothetical protein
MVTTFEREDLPILAALWRADAARDRPDLGAVANEIGRECGAEMPAAVTATGARMLPGWAARSMTKAHHPTQPSPRSRDGGLDCAFCLGTT